jgi:integrase
MPEAPRIDRSLTLGSVVDRYLEAVTPAKRSNETERYRLKKLRRDPICETPLSQLSTARIAEYRDRRAQTIGPGTICRELSLLNHMLDLARREWGVSLQVNPVRDVRKPRLNNARTRRLGEDEWLVLYTALQQSRNDWILPVVQLAVHTGLRRGDILDLRWSRLDLQACTAFIPKTKTDKPRTIPLTPAAVHVLARLPRKGDIVFPTSANAIKLAWVRAIKRAGIEDLHFHDLRHEAVSRFFELGLSMPEVALISGHRDPRMLMRYTHLSAFDLATKLRSLTSG